MSMNLTIEPSPSQRSLSNGRVADVTDAAEAAALWAYQLAAANAAVMPVEDVLKRREPICPVFVIEFDYDGSFLSSSVGAGGSRPLPYRTVFLPEPPQPGEDERVPAARGHRDRDGALYAGTSTMPGAGVGTGDNEFVPWEVVIGANGQPRQAGSLGYEGDWIVRYKRRAEQSLFVFLRGVLGRFFLTSHFHKDMCDWLQRCPPFRKMLLMPREHAKTAIVSGGLPAHILVQPAEGNIYFPGLEGSECRILLSGETATMAQKNLRVVQSIFMENKLFRAFWPHRCWENERESQQWNNDGIIIPRKNEWPDPSIRAVGVGGAVTGARPNVMIKDDLTTLEAANSEVVMDMAIEWHVASRALLDKYEIESGLQSLEFIAATRWAVYDLCSYIMDNDPSVEVNGEEYHRIIRDGKILWPEKYTMEDIDQLRHEHGTNFYLLYLNSAADPSLTDFDVELVRDFEIVNGVIRFTEDERDGALVKAFNRRKERESGEVPLPVVERGTPLNDVIMRKILETRRAFRLRAA